MTDGIVKQQGHTMVNIAIRAMRRGLCDDRLADDLQLIFVDTLHLANPNPV